MAATLSSTQAGSSPDYYRYVTDAVTKTDRLGDPDLLDFTVVKTDDQFVRLKRGAYIRSSSDLLTDNKGTKVDWFTGYITNDPEYSYVGLDSKTQNPVFGFKYEAQSDECILSQQALGIRRPFINMTQGQILAALAEQLLPGMFDTSGIQDGLFLARYVIDPTKTYQDIVKEFSTAAVYRFWGRDMKLWYTPQDAAQFSADIAPTTIDRNDKHFTPANLSIRATQQGIINDAIVLGATEPREYVTEYFVGDGSTALFPMMNSAFGVESALLLDDDFSSGQIDSSKWNTYDTPTNFLQVSDGYLNVLGGSQNGSLDVHLDSANLIPVAGNIRITHGDFEFIDAGQLDGVLGVVGGLWTQTPNINLTGCIYGVQVKQSSYIVTLTEVVNGALTANSVVVNFTKSYVIRTNLSASRINRTLQSFTYLDAAGNLQSVEVPVESYPDSVGFTTYISEIDLVEGTLSNGFPLIWNTSLSLPANHATYANYVLVASSNLHLTVTDTTISTPMQASLEVNKAVILPTAEAELTLTATVDSPTANPTGTVTFMVNGAVVGTAPVASGSATLTIGANQAQGVLSGTFAPSGTTQLGVVNVFSSQASTVTFQTGTEYAQQIIGPNEVDALDGLTPTATITQSGGITKSTTLGTPKYQAANPTLAFFKNSNNYTSTVPGVADLIKLKYRQAGASIARVRDQASVEIEAVDWGDSGIRSVTRSDLSPQPTTSSECEAAAAAIIYEASRTRFEGTYKVFSPWTTVEPLAGMVLPFKNMPTETFGQTNFAEMIYEVQSTLVSTEGGEIYEYDISFGKATDQLRVAAILSKIDDQPDVFSPEDSAEVPNYVSPNSVGTAWSPDLLYLEVSGHDADNLYITAPSSLPAGTGIEVRSTDSSWGCDQSRNLIGRFSTQSFAVPRNAHNKAVFAKLYDTRNQWMWSEDLTKVPSSSSLAAFSLAQAVNPDGHLSLVTKFAATSPVSSADFDINVQLSSGLGCFSMSYKGQPGTTFTLGVIGADGRLIGTTQMCDGAWQRLSISYDLSATGAGHVLYRVQATGEVHLCRASVEIGVASETVFCKTNGSPYGALSRYASAVRVNLPLVPPPPAAALSFSDISDPVVTLTLPQIAMDVWGYEIRASDNSTVLEHQDVSDTGVAPVIGMPQVRVRDIKYYCYCYNLLGEYSKAAVVEFQLPSPALGEVTIADKTKMLEWDSTNSTGFILKIDTVDSTFTHLSVNQLVKDNFFQLSDADFFGERWFSLTPYDDLGTGDTVTAEHSYLPDQVVSLGTNEVGVIVSPASGASTITVPDQFQKYGSEYSTIAYAMYKRNTG